MSSDLDVIKAIVNAFDRSDWAEIDVSSGSLRVRLSTQPQIAPGAEPAPTGGVVLTGVADHKPVEILLDADGRIKRGRCLCGHHQKAGLRMGPCRHLLALRILAWRQTQPGG